MIKMNRIGLKVQRFRETELLTKSVSITLQLSHCPKAMDG